LTDRQLLQQYVRQNSQAAFSQIVARHFNFVYSVCRRETGDAALAEDITQVVFLILARKASSVRVETSLSGWLFQTTRFAAKNARRREANRKRQEQIMEEHLPLKRPTELGRPSEEIWNQIEPSLNAALAALSAKDREAILLRFADGLSFPELSQALGTSEDAARMRLNRAVNRLRQFFAAAGIPLSAAVLAGLLADRTVQAAPAACAVTGAASKLSPQVQLHLQGVLKAMTMTKITLTVAGLFAASVAILPLMTLAQSRRTWQAKKPIVKNLTETAPLGTFPELELRDGFTLHYVVTKKDARTPEMKASETQQIINELQRSVLQGNLKQAEADRSIQSVKMSDKMPVTQREYRVTLSAYHGKLLYMSQQQGTPSYGLTTDNHWVTEPYETKIVLYDGQKTYSIRSFPAQRNEIPLMWIYPGFRPDDMRDCLLPGIGLPSMPLAKMASPAKQSHGAAIQCDVFSFSGNRYWPGIVYLQGTGRNAKLTRLIVGQSDHPVEVWKFREPQAFQGGWISRSAAHATFPFMFPGKPVSSGPEKIASYSVTDIQPAPLAAAQFDIHTYLVPGMNVEDHSVQKYGMETHSFRYNPAGGDFEAQEKSAAAH